MADVGNGAVVITGASTGIGEACALRLVRLGYQVFAGVRKEEDGAALQQKAAITGRLTPIIIDVTEPTTIAAASQRVSEAVGNRGLAGLINNAGIAVAGPLEFLPVAQFRQQLEVNVTGQLAVTQAFMSLLRQGQGRIINMGSVSGLLATPMTGAYAASKFALEAFTDALRLELRPWNIAVAIIEPSGIATPIWEKSATAADKTLEELPPQAQELYGPLIKAVRRVARHSARAGLSPEKVADAVVHALTAPKPKTRYVVGQQVWLQMVILKLPDRVRDYLITRQLERLAK